MNATSFFQCLEIYVAADNPLLKQPYRLTVLRDALHSLVMIISFKHKGLERFYCKGTTGGIQAKHQKKLRLQLAALDTAQVIDDLNLPGYRLHSLKGERKGIWAISVSGNWRLTFQFENGNVTILNYEDYH